MRKIIISIILIVAISLSLSACEIQNPEVVKTFSDTNQRIVAARSNFSDSINQLFTTNSVDEVVAETFDFDIRLYQEAEIKEVFYYVILGTHDYEDPSGKTISVTKHNEQEYTLSHQEDNKQIETQIKTREKTSYMSVDVDSVFKYRLEKSDLTEYSAYVIEETEEMVTNQQNIFAIQYVENNQMGGYTVLQIYINEDNGRMAVYENVEEIPSSIYGYSLSSGFASSGDRNYAVNGGELSYNID